MNQTLTRAYRKFEQMKENQLVIESRSYNTQYGVWTYFMTAL